MLIAPGTCRELATEALPISHPLTAVVPGLDLSSQVPAKQHTPTHLHQASLQPQHFFQCSPDDRVNKEEGSGAYGLWRGLLQLQVYCSGHKREEQPRYSQLLTAWC